MIRYGSVCSGIEAATMAWHPLGWSPAFFAEIEKFPSAVLAHHYGSNMPGDPLATNGVPNYGDFTQIGADAGPVDLLVGGTPCQSFSVAGKRLGLDDPRGNLALEYLALARRLGTRWILWENVPGVLSSTSDEEDGEGGVQPGLEGREAGDEWIEESDFATFLEFVRECGYGFAYRVLDAQYIRVDEFARAVPQRRRRVFVVGYLGDWRRAAAVLLEPESMRRDTPPLREAGKGVAPTISARPSGGGGLGTDFDLDGGLISMAHGQGGAEIGIGHCPTLSCNHEAPIVAHAIAFDTTQITSAANYSAPKDGDPCHPLAAGAYPPAVAFDLRGREGGSQFEGPHDSANIRAGSGGSSRSYVAEAWAVRRLTPRECERLQGFPDGFTDVPFNRKSAADGPRYKALGNSMAVNAMRWIGQRIDIMEKLIQSGQVGAAITTKDADHG